MTTPTTERLRSPISWFGGKGNMTARLLPLLEAAQPTGGHYCEPFGGGASLLLAKTPPGGVETYNDLDSALYDFFMTLSDPALFEAFYARVAPLPYSRQLYTHCRATWQDHSGLERVWRWYVVARQSFSGAFGVSWSYVVTQSTRGMAGNNSKWLSTLDMLPRIHARLQRVQIENNDWRVVLAAYDTPDTLFYLDPPYIATTRSSGSYAHELSDADHADLAAALLRVQGAAVLSGYAHALYAPLEDAGWQRQDWVTASYATGRTRGIGLLGAGAALAFQRRVESAWLNPRAQAVMAAAAGAPVQQLSLFAAEAAR